MPPTMRYPMNSSLHPPSVAALKACGRRLLASFVLACHALSFIPGCTGNDDPNKKRKPRKDKPVRDPIENKVFYKGWWPENW